MISTIVNKIKTALGIDELSSMRKLKSEIDICKSNINELHEYYESGVTDDKAHFAELEALYYKEKEFSHKLSSKLESFITKANSDFKYKDKLKSSLGKERKEMPQVDSENVTDFVLHFNDKVGVKKVTRKISQLKPAQKEINEDKVYDFIAEYFSNTDKKENKFIISNDNYILDGHHRWAADLEMSEDDKTVSCYKINLPAAELIRQANRLKMTKQVDIDDETFKKAISVIALAQAEGYLNEDLLELVKARTGKLVPITKTVIKNGKRFSQIFWVAPEEASELRGSTIVRSEAPERRLSRDYSKENEKKHAELYKQQKEDDSITNVGDKVDVNYVGRSSGETFSFKNLSVVAITEDSISVKMNEDVFSKKKYNDGMNIVFRKDAVIRIPKHNAKDWGDDNNYKLQLDESTRNQRLDNLNFLKRIQDYAQQAKDKGYSIYEDVLLADVDYIKSKYAPFFAKYGKSFDPIKMFDDCKEHIENHFGENTVMKARFGTSGFSIDAFQDGKRVMHTTRNFLDGHQMVDPANTKGIYHAYFKIDNKKHWGGGLAKKLFCSYYEQYEKMGLQFLSVTAGLESGPYVWPSFGFYGTVEKARQVLSQFKEGRSREILKIYAEQNPEVERAYKEGNKIFIKYTDSENPVDVTNEMVSLNGPTQEQVDKKEEFLGLFTEYNHVSNLITEYENSGDKHGALDESEIQQELQEIHNAMVEAYNTANGIEETSDYPDVSTIKEYFDNIPNDVGLPTKRYAVDGAGDVYEPAKSVVHVITKQEEEHANKVFTEFVETYPTAKAFPNTNFTADPILRQASKVAFLNAGGAGYFVDLTNNAHKQDFEKRIGYQQYKKQRNESK